MTDESTTTTVHFTANPMFKPGDRVRIGSAWAEVKSVEQTTVTVRYAGWFRRAWWYISDRLHSAWRWVRRKLVIGDARGGPVP